MKILYLLFSLLLLIFQASPGHGMYKVHGLSIKER